MAVDGSIIIDTRIDQKGIATGVKGINKALGSVLNSVKSIGKALVAAFVGGSILNSLRGVVGSFDLMKSSLADTFKPLTQALDTLKGAFINLIATALVPMMPHIISMVQWLTDLIFKITQVVAGLFGMKKTIGGIVGETKKAGKEAKGALAAFDQLNVLQKPDAPDDETPFITPEAMEITKEMQAIVDEILRKIQVWKDILDILFDNPLAALNIFRSLWETLVDWFKTNVIDRIAEWWNSTSMGGWITALRENFINSWKAIIANTIETLQKIKENVLRVFNGIKEFLIGVFTGDWQRAWEGLKEVVRGIFGALRAWIEGVLKNITIFIEGFSKGIQILFGPIIDWIAEKIGAMIEIVQQVAQKIQDIWGALTKWFFDNVWQPLREGFGLALEWVQDKFSDVFDKVKGFVKGVINGIIDYINTLMQTIASAINLIVTGFNAVGSIVPGFVPMGYIDAPRIPKLATGAVIPPNSEFMAVLGDQRGGRNIEAPEALIRQIVREETGKMQADIRLEFGGSLGELVRTLKPYIDRENVRVGGSLIKSGVSI